jgi:hypothetical protein
MHVMYSLLTCAPLTSSLLARSSTCALALSLSSHFLRLTGGSFGAAGAALPPPAIGGAGAAGLLPSPPCEGLLAALSDEEGGLAEGGCGVPESSPEDGEVPAGAALLSPARGGAEAVPSAAAAAAGAGAGGGAAPSFGGVPISCCSAALASPTRCSLPHASSTCYDSQGAQRCKSEERRRLWQRC